MALFTRVTEAELDEFVTAYAKGARKSSRGIEAGTVNTSYVLELADGRFFLRIYEEQGMEGARREADLLVHLAGAGVPTPAPVAGRDGAFVRALAGKPAAIFPWIEGGMLCQAAVTPRAAHEVGRALASVHLVGPAPGAPLGAGRFGPDALVLRCDRVATSNDPDARAQAAALRAAVRAIASRRRSDLPSGLVHGDLFRDNVLWTPSGEGDRSKIAALLDFESAHQGPFVYDLAVTILSWAYGAELDLAIARAVVAGYREVREIEPVEREAFFDEAILATLRFTITRITDEAIRVGKRWQRFVARREALERLGRAGVREALGW